MLHSCQRRRLGKEVEAVIDSIGDQRGYPEPFYLPEYKDETYLLSVPDQDNSDMSHMTSSEDSVARLLGSSSGLVFLCRLKAMKSVARGRLGYQMP